MEACHPKAQGPSIWSDHRVLACAFFKLVVPLANRLRSGVDLVFWHNG
jgi:hypothetical protein